MSEDVKNRSTNEASTRGVFDILKEKVAQRTLGNDTPWNPSDPNTAPTVDQYLLSNVFRLGPQILGEGMIRSALLKGKQLSSVLTKGLTDDYTAAIDAAVRYKTLNDMLPEWDKMINSGTELSPDLRERLLHARQKLQSGHPQKAT